jgi:hypothetical protein
MEDPKEIGIVTKCMLNGKNIKPDVSDECIHLNKDLFKESARIYSGMGSTAVLKNSFDELLTISYDGFENIVLWQTLNSDADLICIEGWNGLPGRYEYIEDVYDAPGRTVLETKHSRQYKVRIHFS